LYCDEGSQGDLEELGPKPGQVTTVRNRWGLVFEGEWNREATGEAVEDDWVEIVV